MDHFRKYIQVGFEAEELEFLRDVYDMDRGLGRAGRSFSAWLRDLAVDAAMARASGRDLEAEAANGGRPIEPPKFS